MGKTKQKTGFGQAGWIIGILEGISTASDFVCWTCGGMEASDWTGLYRWCIESQAYDECLVLDRHVAVCTCIIYSTRISIVLHLFTIRHWQK